MKEYKLEEIKSSVLQYDKKPPRFMLILVYVIVGFIVATVVWAAFSERTEVERVTGTVTASDKTYVMSAVQGTISQVVVTEGQYVEVGDLLAKIDSAETEGQVALYAAQTAYYSNILSKYEIMINTLQNYNDDYNVGEVDTNTNPFDSTSDYYYYSTYQSALDAIAKTAEKEEIKGLREQYISSYYNYYSQYEQYFV